MCFDAIRLAADTRGLSASQKLVLLCLADYAQEKDMKAWPSVSVIAEWSGLNRKSVIQAVKFLEDEGFLMVKKENGKGNVYTLLTHTKNGTRTKIGTGTKNGTSPVPKTGLDQYQNWDTNLLRTNKEPINTSAASLSTQPEERSLFPEIKSEEKNKSSKISSKPRKALTHELDLEILPDDWRKNCEELRPDLDPEYLFKCFRLYWTKGDGAGTKRSDKGWNQTWLNRVKSPYAEKLQNNQNSYCGPSSNPFLRPSGEA